jgi:hypothetical protein
MRRLNDLSKWDRLDMIEETRWQMGQELVAEAIRDNWEINSMCDWAKTRQGAEYWAMLSKM